LTGIFTHDYAVARATAGVLEARELSITAVTPADICAISTDISFEKSISNMDEVIAREHRTLCTTDQKRASQSR